MGKKLFWSRDITRYGHIMKKVKFLVRVTVIIRVLVRVLVSVRVRVRIECYGLICPSEPSRECVIVSHVIVECLE